MTRIRTVLAIMAVAAAAAFAGCSDGSTPHDQAQAASDANTRAFKAYVPGTPNTEQTNYNKAQELYNDPSSILWCSVLSQSSTAPIITVPIAGKLTSSTTTANQPEYAKTTGGDSAVALPSASVDGLYHPNPPPYRYGFTPGGQYVDFFNTPTVCTTKPLEFQRQSVSVKVDSSLSQATARASQALHSGNEDKAQAILEAAAGQ